MRVVRKSLTISTPSGSPATYNLKWQPPKGALVAAIGIGVDSLAALYDTEVTGIEHGARQAVKTFVEGNITYGPPLGHVACRVEHDDLSDVARLAPAKFKAWPGRINSPRDLRVLQSKLQQGYQPGYNERLRLRMAGKPPCEDFAMWPLKELVDFKISLKRIYGSTTIARAWLYLIEFESKQEMELYCGQPDLTDYPQWVTQALVLDNTAAVDGTDKETLWPGAFSGINPHGLRILQIFSMGHSNDGGTITYAPDYTSAALVNLKHGGGESVAPFYADERVMLGEFTSQLLQHYDCWRNPDLILKWHSSLLWETERLATDYQKDLRLSLYGLLRPQDAEGNIRDAA